VDSRRDLTGFRRNFIRTDTDEYGVSLALNDGAGAGLPSIYWVSEPYTDQIMPGRAYYWSRHAEACFATQPGLRDLACAKRSPPCLRSRFPWMSTPTSSTAFHRDSTPNGRWWGLLRKGPRACMERKGPLPRSDVPLAFPRIGNAP